ncbi:SDR family NAD(P)-dependent oxidoreductase [Erythrobacter insulae]|uniref:SDR family NAD(P)-dependent oxidoreductase n=1 Tax=Erythrobacter insulae TaxID=2584124 RepID=A0A547PBG4_9SPHN|nr:oxidoreductase [Erythrobacter insulae]TRD11487.1 SDR family NAD(P)-dependent oxidoreductase [Erythrobacter insulae]
MPHLNTSGITGWTPDALPDLAGRLYIITGGNSGIGFEAAKILAAHNADVVIAARNADKGRQALAKLVNIGRGKAEMLQLDLADMAQVRLAAQEAKERFGPIAALVNNAGVMQTPKQRTADGFEMQLGTNHLGHFLWTALMFDQIDPSQGRVVTVSSIMHKFGRIDFDNLMMERGYDPNRAYNQSKLANLLFALELHRLLEAAGSSVKSIACHPGYSDTPLQSKVANPLFKLVYTASNAIIAQPAARGAWPTALAAAEPGAVSGGYFGPTGFFDARGPVGDADVERRAMDAGVAKRLWQVSADLVGEELTL